MRFAHIANIVNNRILDKSGMRMLELHPVVEWFHFQMPFVTGQIGPVFKC
jgi:hypothetical protein